MISQPQITWPVPILQPIVNFSKILFWISKHTLNRTWLELKLKMAFDQTAEKGTVNRTWLELKLKYCMHIDYGGNTVNRTWLELKPNRAKGLPMACSSVNRTWLELKLDKDTKRLVNELAVNRTWLELKPVSGGRLETFILLLIAPDWNWNQVGLAEITSAVRC